MSAPITPADREAARPSAHHLIARGGGCFIIRGKHSDHCDAGTEVVAQAFADARIAYRRQVAAYLLDRADQIETKRWEWNPLVDAAQAVVRGEVEAAVAHGELAEPELLARVDGFARRKHG